MSGESSQGRGPWLLFLHCVAVFSFLYLPIAVLVVYSFNGAGVGGFPPRDLTLNWYRILLDDGASVGIGGQQPAGCVGGHGDCARIWYSCGAGA